MNNTDQQRARDTRIFNQKTSCVFDESAQNWGTELYLPISTVHPLI